MPYNRISQPIKTAALLSLLLPVPVAVLFPIWAASRGRAPSASCISNVKQLSLSILQYVQDYDEVLPPSAQWASAGGSYFKGENVLHCPGAATLFSYAFNHSLDTCKVSEVQEPQFTILFFEADAFARNAAGSREDVTRQNRHYNMMSYGFFDGHAKNIGGDDLASAYSNSISRWKPTRATPEKKP